MPRIRSLYLFYRERYVFFLFNAAVLFLVISLINTIIHFQPTERVVTLHFNYFYGIDYVGSWFQAYYYWIAMLAAVMVNFFLSFWVFTRDKYMSYYILLAAAMMSGVYSLYIFLLTPYT